MPVSPPAAMASRSTAGNQKRRRKRRRSGAGRRYARFFASSLRVCLADIEIGILFAEMRGGLGSGHAGNFQAHAAEATERSHRHGIITYGPGARREIGRASCKERGEIGGVGGT